MSSFVFVDGHFDLPFGILSLPALFTAAYMGISGARKINIGDKPLEKGVLFASAFFIGGAYWFLWMLPQQQRLAFIAAFALFGVAWLVKRRAVNTIYKVAASSRELEKKAPSDGSENDFTRILDSRRTAWGLYGLNLILNLGAFGAYIFMLTQARAAVVGNDITKGVCVGFSVLDPFVCPGYAFLIVGVAALLVNLLLDAYYLYIRRGDL